MKRLWLDEEERIRREQVVREFYQWKATTGSRSRMKFAEISGIDHEDLVRCLKWNSLLKQPKVPVPKKKQSEKQVPTLVPVGRREQVQPSGVVRISMKNSSIDLSGDVSPAVVQQVLTTLGALDVL